MPDRSPTQIVDSDENGSNASVETRFVDEGEQVALVNSGSNGLMFRYLHGPRIDQILAHETIATPGAAGEVRWSIADHLGSIRQIVDASGVVKAIIDYDAFGNPSLLNSLVADANGDGVTDAADAGILFMNINGVNLTHAEGDVNRDGIVDGADAGFMFAEFDVESYGSTDLFLTILGHTELYTGRDFDAEVWLQYNRARYYDAKVGRWISEDPIGFAAGDYNLSRYVRISPTNFIDPSGNAQENAHWANGGHWWLRQWSINYHGWFGETRGGEFKAKTWGNWLFRNPLSNWLAAGTVSVLDVSGTVQLKDTIICDGRRIPVEINISGTAHIHYKVLNRLTHLTFLTRAGILKGPLASATKGAAFYQLGAGFIKTFLDGKEFWARLKHIARETNDLNGLKTVIDTDSMKLRVSPLLVIKSGLTSLRVDIAGLDFGSYEIGFGGRREGPSFYSPGKGKWSDGMVNWEQVYPMKDFQLTP